jgi:hypothetical protein
MMRIDSREEDARYAPKVRDWLHEISNLAKPLEKGKWWAFASLSETLEDFENLCVELRSHNNLLLLNNLLISSSLTCFSLYLSLFPSFSTDLSTALVKFQSNQISFCK